MRHIKIITLSIFATVFIAAFSFAAFADYVESPWIYTVKDDAVTITGYMGGESPCVVPWTLADLDIKKVKGGIFIGKKDDEGKDINIVYVPNNNVSFQNNDQITVIYYNLGEPLPEPDTDENPGEPLPEPDTDENLGELVIGADEDSGNPVIGAEENSVDPVRKEDENPANPFKDTDTGKNGDADSPGFSSGGSSAGGGRTAYESVEIAVAPPDVDFELEEIEEETVVVTPMEEAVAPVILDENGEEMDVFRVAGVVDSEEADAGDETSAVTGKSDSPVVSKDNVEDRPEFDGLTQSTGKTALIIIAACLAVIAAAGGVYIFIHKR